MGCHIQNDGHTIGHVLDRQADLFQPATQQALVVDRLRRARSVRQHMEMLSAVGFGAADVLYKRDIFAIYAGVK